MTKLFICLYILALPSVAQALQLSEIAYDVVGTDSGREWVEVYNESDQPVDLNGYTFTDGSSHKLIPPPSRGGQGSLVLSPRSYAILAADAVTFLQDHPGYSGTVVDTVMSLPNYQKDAERSVPIALYAADNVLVDQVAYRPTSKGQDGHTQTRYQDDVWADSLKPGGTPGQSSPGRNSVIYSKSVQLSEILSNPMGSDMGQEWIELKNTSTESVDLDGWYFTDKPTASGQIKRHPIQGIIIPASGYVVIALKEALLNNEGEVVNLYWPNDQLVESVVIDGQAAEAATWASTDGQWRWTEQATPGQENIYKSILPSPSRSALAQGATAVPLRSSVLPTQRHTASPTVLSSQSARKGRVAGSSRQQTQSDKTSSLVNTPPVSTVSPLALTHRQLTGTIKQPAGQYFTVIGAVAVLLFASIGSFILRRTRLLEYLKSRGLIT